MQSVIMPLMLLENQNSRSSVQVAGAMTTM
jgi:hypothetical protein